MTVITEYIFCSTRGNTDIFDVTKDIQKVLAQTGLKKGSVTASVIGSTAALTTCEFEPGLVADIKEIFQKLIPQGRYQHDQTWGDGNGHAHLRASLVGPSLSIPFVKGELILGTWQQVIFIDFDNRARKRKIVLQFIGE